MTRPYQKSAAFMLLQQASLAMNKITTTCFTIAILFTVYQPTFAAKTNSGHVEITFTYNRVARDYANNQFAVWIEDQSGTLVTTLFVTEFTATRGWKIRKDALPTWKKKSNISHLSKDVLDAVSGATPKAGRLSFVWNGKNDANIPVPKGSYNYFVECNYYWADTVLYHGTIQVGDQKNSSKAIPSFSTESAENYTIIDNVEAVFSPIK